MTGSTDPTVAATDTGGLRALAVAAGSFRLDPAVDSFMFLRHGRTAGNIRRVYQHPDDPLAPEGFADADHASKILSHRRFAQIAASDMARAWLTSGRVAAATGKPVIAVPGLRERFFGGWIGKSSTDLDWRAEPPNGETLPAFVARAADGINAALALRPGEILLVSHGGVLQVVAGMLGIRLAPELTRNALPLSFTRAGAGWLVEPLA